MISILYKPSFVRQYKKISPELQQEAREKIAFSQKDPSAASLRVHKLKGKLQEFWSFSVNYRYRIVFQRLSDNEVVLLAIGNHDVYQ